MSHKIPALVAVAALCATTLAITSPGGAQAPSETALSYTVRPAGGTFVDSKPKGDSRGDFVVFEGRLLTGRRVIGRERGTCFVASARTHVAICTMGWVLPDGTLTTSGATSAEPPFTVPITGGTSRFAGARGTALVQPTKVTFQLLP